MTAGEHGDDPGRSTAASSTVSLAPAGEPGSPGARGSIGYFGPKGELVTETEHSEEDPTAMCREGREIQDKICKRQKHMDRMGL